LPSAFKNNLPVAEEITEQVLCLPIYSDLNQESAEMICKLINQLRKRIKNL